MTYKINFEDKSFAYSSYTARTLDASEVNSDTYGYNEFTHEDGWTIKAIVHEDYYTWINNFEATHPIYGYVKGDFEYEVLASSQEAYEHFVANHPYNEWDYGDI